MAVRFSPRGMYLGRCHIPLKYMVLVWLLLMLVAAWMFITTDHSTASCRHKDMLEYVCRFYSKGTITGKMCPRLCEEKEFVYTKCLSKSPQHQVYEVVVKHPTKPKTNEHLLVHWTHDLKDGDYDRPEQGSSMEDLRVMVTAYLRLRLGEGEHTELQTRIIDVADVNNDGKVSLAEAKTLWALLRGNDFLIIMALSKSELIPKLEGFCGDVYVTEGVVAYELYGPKRAFPGGLGAIFQHRRPLDWTQRAHIVLGVIEFVEEVIDNPLGNFLMCSVTPRSIGYTQKYDAKLLGLEDIIPEVIVEGALQERHCVSDSECLYGANCQSPCSSMSHKCFGEVTYPNLYKMCELLEPVLFDGVPKQIDEKLRETVNRCMELRHSGRKMDMEHSLVINDIKGIIWRQISNAKS